VRVVSMEKELTKLADVTVELAKGNGRMNLIEDRQLAQGKRLDETGAALGRQLEELTRRLNVLIDERRS
jgi:hypothetical protein